MKDLLMANWIILTPVFFLSVLMLALVIAKSVFFYRIRWKRPDVLPGILARVGQHSSAVLLKKLEQSDFSPAVSLLRKGLLLRETHSQDQCRERLEALRDHALDRMERYVSLLSGVGNVATLLGLFGTVSGMITAFSRMNATGISDPYVLAGGISRALVTTAAGLAVAIPASLAQHFFDMLVERHAERMERVISACLYRSGGSHARARATSFQTP